MRQRMKYAALAVLAATMATPVDAQTRWQDSPAVKQLHEAAKKEGKVVAWGTAASEVEWISKAFSAEFPGITVEVLGDNDVGTKAVAEFRAGRHQIDVFQTSYTAGRPLLERNMYTKNDWKMFGVVDDNIAFDGKGGMTHNLVYAIVYNKNLVKPNEVPKEWTELLDPKYKDRMIASTFLLPRLIGALGLVWQEQKAVQFARDITQTGILLTRAPPQNFLQSGERHFAVANFISQSKDWSSQGLPVEGVIPSPVIAAQFYAAVMDKAPHPNAARLLAGYMASEAGKKARSAANHTGDYRKTSSDPVAKQIWSSNVPLVFDTLEDMPLREALIAKVNPIIAGQAR